MEFLNAIFALAAFGPASPAADANTAGIYVSGALAIETQDERLFGADPTFVTDADRGARRFTSFEFSATPRRSVDNGFGLGRFASLAAGYRIGEIFRVEAEASYLFDTVDIHRAFSVDLDEKTTFEDEDGDGILDGTFLRPAVGDVRDLGISVGNLVRGGTGTIEAAAGFVNGFVDVPAGRYDRLEPYLGAGLGAAQIDAEYSENQIRTLDIERTVFAYQVMVGAAYEIRPNCRLQLDARFRGMSGADMPSRVAMPDEFRVENAGAIAQLAFDLRY